jgi:hypothetical protein
MIKKLFLSLLLLLLSISAAQSQAATTMTLTGSTPSPFYIQEVSSSSNILTGTLTITRTDASADEYYVIDLQPVSTARQSWLYNYNEGYQTVGQANIYTDDKKFNKPDYIAKTWGIEQNTNEDNFWIGIIPAGVTQKDVLYYLKFQDYEAPYPPAGVFQLDLQFRLWNYNYNPNTDVQSPPASLVPKIKQITLTVLNEAYVYITFADNDSLPISKIALDETSNMTKSLKMLTKSNYWRYDVTVTSINGGTLNFNTGTSIEKIPYNLWIIDMITPINFTLTPVKTVLVNQPIITYSLPPAIHDAKIQVLYDSTANYTAGRYSDIIRLEIKQH